MGQEKCPDARDEVLQCCQVGRNWRRLVGILTFSAPEFDKWLDFLQKVRFPSNEGHWSTHGLATM